MNSLEPQKAFSILHASEISAARRYSTQLADALGFTETEAGRLAIIVTEAATNMLKHAQDGLLLLRPESAGPIASIEVLALDAGPGIASLPQSLRDGMSTAGTAGTGLGAMRRQADAFDAYSTVGKGSVFYMRVQRGGSVDAVSEHGFQIGAVCLPIAGEEQCGDAWAFAGSDGSATLMVADGLGHGPDAATASSAAVGTTERHLGLAPGAMMQEIHLALRPTRGAAVAVASFSVADVRLQYAGVGNIAACVTDGSGRKQLVSHNGIVGHNMRKVQEFSVPWEGDEMFIMCSDGISTQWDLGAYPGLAVCHPAIIAGVLYRDFSRRRDDATAVVVRRRNPG